MPSFSRNTDGGTNISGGVLAPRSQRGNTNQVALYWDGVREPQNSPTSLSSTPDTTSVSIAFTAPTSDGGSTIINYEYSFNNTSWTALSPTDAVSPVTVDSLTVTTAYSVYLRAVNTVGSGPASLATTFNTLTPPPFFPPFFPPYFPPPFFPPPDFPPFFPPPDFPPPFFPPNFCPSCGNIGLCCGTCANVKGDYGCI
ncbi:Fibronectin type III [uncultured Caudovirales phage]|uniref:Fibronectin type III n=1 Tax=uncultured Caudovirales phage TaxID=2100421 RepID=A0A6J5QWK2_9CAUD|nr:Fibronectin type III [uncultured Caudovirales phage]